MMELEDIVVEMRAEYASLTRDGKQALDAYSLVEYAELVENAAKAYSRTLTTVVAIAVTLVVAAAAVAFAAGIRYGELENSPRMQQIRAERAALGLDPRP